MSEDVDEQRELLKSLWEPHPGQRAIMNHPARYRIVVCGRRWGKSEMAAHLALEYALEEPDRNVWWVAPTYDQANEYGFDKIRPLLSRDITADDPKLSKPRKIQLVTGSTISFRSAEREDSLRGGGVDFLVIDEASSVADRAWVEELRPTLSDTQGDVVAIGTPKRRNWFYRWFQRGQSDEYPDVASWQAPTGQNPHVPEEEIEQAGDDMPNREFRREYHAEFLDETGGVFIDLEELALADYDPADVDGEEPYATGVDFARSDDYTVIITLDTSGTLVHFDRLRRVGWPEIQRRIEAAVEQYPGAVSVDGTRDNKIVSDLVESGLQVEPVRFTATRKRELVEDLITTIEKGVLTLPDRDPLAHELQVFERETTRAGGVRYSAPDGFHDDCVDALALAVDAFDDRGGIPAKTARLGGDGGDDGEVTVGSREFRESAIGEALHKQSQRNRKRWER